MYLSNHRDIDIPAGSGVFVKAACRRCSIYSNPRSSIQHAYQSALVHQTRELKSVEGVANRLAMQGGL